MNLASMIEAAARSAPFRPATIPHPRLKNLLLGGPSQSVKALARYRAVMAGKGWMTQSRIEGALGYAATVSTDYLKKLKSEGHVERRNRNGSKTYERRSGYEWRWKE